MAPYECTTEELRWFYSIDRQIFTRMVVDIGLDFAQSTKLIALWIWLEITLGFPTMTLKLQNKGEVLVSSVAEEGAIGLKYIEENMQAPSPDIDLPLTSNLYKRRISLGLLHENRERAFIAITRMATGNLKRAFQDIVDGEVTRRMEREREMTMRFIASSFNVDAANDPRTTLMNDMVRQQSLQQSLYLNPTPQAWTPYVNVTPEDRMMFVTFSKGYPVSREEVVEFFVSSYGDCVEAIEMEEVPPFAQPLYARVVFHSPSMIPRVLDGQTKAKFVINGKHVWMRKFVPKHGRA